MVTDTFIIFLQRNETGSRKKLESGLPFLPNSFLVGFSISLERRQMKQLDAKILAARKIHDYGDLCRYFILNKRVIPIGE